MFMYLLHFCMLKYSTVCHARLLLSAEKRIPRHYLDTYKVVFCQDPKLGSACAAVQRGKKAAGMLLLANFSHDTSQ